MMDEQVDNATLEPEMQNQLTPGQMLSRAREEQGLSHIEIARKLNLKLQWVMDIEHDNYKDASALIYVRGYLRSYANLVGLSAEEVLERFSAMNFDEPFKQASSGVDEQFLVKQPVLSHMKSSRNRGSGISRWIWLAVVVILVAFAAMWWRSTQTSANSMSHNAKPTQPSPQASAANGAQVKPGKNHALILPLLSDSHAAISSTTKQAAQVRQPQ